MPKFRLLPTLIVLAGLMLSVRIGAVWDGMSTRVTSVSVGQSVAVAQEAPADPAAGQPAQDAAAPPPADGEAPPADGAGDGAQMADGADPAATDGALPQRPRDGSAAFTQSEIDLLQRLSERREQIELRERELEQREAILQAAEDRIDRKIGDLAKLEETIKNLLAEQTEEEKAKVAKLVNIYKAMKPKDAARILDQMEMSILLELFVAMTERNSAAILAEMDPLKAQAVTTELATQKTVPLPDGADG